MGFDFTGFVLRAPRTAPSNAVTTDEASNGVDRDFKPLSADYQIPSPDLVETSAAQYRAAVLLRPNDGQTEYLVWAANTADLRDAGAFIVSDATVTFPQGSILVVDEDNPFGASGSNRAIIIDDANRTISSVTSLVVRRGDTAAEIELVGHGSFNSVSGVFTITDPATLAELGGGVSSARGDRASAQYTISPPAFWWSRNDRYENRFKWDGRVQRWRPIRGTPPRDLGVLLVDESYVLSPSPSHVTLGSFLPGNSTAPDSYAMVRIGTRPDASSVPVAEPVGGSGFGGIKVVTDDEVEDFDFGAEPTLAGIVGQASGQLVWNPAFINVSAGQRIFYSYRGFVDQDVIEPLGQLEDANLRLLFISPIPGPTEYPFIRIGSRQPLEAILVETEEALAALVVQEHQVGVALSTGRLKFADADLARADPVSPDFDVGFLGALVFYDGVSLSQRPVPMRAPVQLVDSGGQPTVVSGKDHQIFIPDAAPTPVPGTSGILFLADGTGAIPNTSTDPGIRPGNGSGLVRQVTGPWDLVLFTDNGQIRSIVVFDDDEERPRFRFRIPRGTAYLDRRKGAGGSEVILGRADLQRFDGRPMFFLQSGVQPSTYAREARMWSRVRDQFVLTGNEVLVVALNGAISTWDASTNPGGVPTSVGGTFTAEQIAQSLAAVLAGGTAVAVNGRVALQTASVADQVFYGDIEIGFGPSGTTDLSGPAALGFLPGWRIRIASTQAVDPPPDIVWLSDNGTMVGVFRSPFNLDSSKDDIADVGHIDRFEDAILTPAISQSPVVLLDRPPLEDVAGYDEGIFFRLQDGLVSLLLQNYEEVYYQFGEEKFSWADEHTESQTLLQPTNNLFLGQTLVIPPSFRLPSKGLSISVAGQPLEPQTLDEDFLLPDDGAPGLALLIDTVGGLVQLGGRGTFFQGGTVFSDTSSDVDFVALGVKAGYQIKITQGDAQGTYVVAQDATLPNQIVVRQPFPVSGGPVPWELYDGVTAEQFDSGVIADTQYIQFNHLPEDPFKIRVLSPLGNVPVDQAAQLVTRLVAVLGDAIAHGRQINVRFGRDAGSDAASMVQLQQENLGQILNSALFVPAPTSERFANDNFSIRVGSKTYTFTDGNLVKVPGPVTFPLIGDIIEVQIGDGLLNFGDQVFVQFDAQDVIYVEDFLTPNSSPNELPSGVVEYRLSDGALNFSAPDMAAHGGDEVFLVERMVATGGTDYTVNPIQGSFLFTTPLREFQIVEANYFRAESGTGSLFLEPIDPDDPAKGTQPVEVTEQLPLFVQLDPATPEGTGDVGRWRFNPTGRTLRDDIEPVFYVESTIYNVGSSPVATFDFENSLALLEVPVPDSSVVRVTYAVLEAFGGEQTYTVSQPPVYRPPFRIEANRSSFTLDGDRTGDVTPGKLLRVAQFPFYIVSSTYDTSTAQTRVDFIPETQLEAGSRDPGSDSLSLITDIPLATEIVPDAPDGFWMQIFSPYEPVNRGFQDILFQANLVAIAVPGHLLELGGLPFVIAGSELSDDGTRTRIEITSFFPRGFASGQDIAKISVRPVYPPNPTQFLGRGGIAVERPFELILFGETAGGVELPGRTLRPSIDYTINLDDGNIEFLSPPQGPLLPTQSLYLRHTRQRAIAPVIVNEFVLGPRFDARFVHIEAPSEENGRLGKILRATYTFSSPDTWFYRTLPLLSYLGEVSDQVARDIAAQLPSFGAAPTVVPPLENATQGRLGLKSQLRDLEDTDRAARVFLEFYNETIIPFEQAQETISGNVIGDRDGKFRFFVGRGKDIPPPGYEDEITGELNRRNIFSELFFAYNPATVFLERDPLVDPTALTVTGDDIEGPYIDPDFLGDLQGEQRALVMNDVDDVVLVSRTRKRLQLFPLKLEAFGRYRRMATPSAFSRIFPERAEAFTLTDPGIGADLESVPINPGVYAFRKRIKRLSIKGDGGNFKVEFPKRASTFLKSIGEIGNPVLGQIENIGSISVRPRLPRARIYAYSNVGFPELDQFIVGFPGFAASPRPAVIATPLPLGDFPIGEGGVPDVAQLAAQGGEIIDLSTGDPDLFTPAFFVWTDEPLTLPKVAFGRPDGRIIDAAAGQSLSFEFLDENFTVTKSIFVGEIILGCIITFVDQDGATIPPNGLLEVSEDPAATNPPIELSRGDTIFVTPPDADVTSGNVDDPPTQEQTAAQIQGLPEFRLNFDLRVDRPDGEYRDITFPSYRDPSIFGLKEVLHQRPPLPLSTIEANVSFRSGRTEPVPIPALTGGFTNDSGDYTLPYLYTPNTEIEVLGIVQESFQAIFADSLVPNAVYPDEIQGIDGQILGALGAGPPAAILTDLDATPVATAGVYAPNSGIGDVAPFDILLVETGQAAAGLPPGSQGILSVGFVDGGSGGSVIEPPRFVTPSALPTAAAERIRYRLKTAMSFVNQSVLALPPGMIVRRVGTVTEFDITQISNAILVFNDGTPAALTGGLNDIFSPPFFGGVQDNVVTINIWSAPDLVNPAPVFFQSVVIAFNNGAPTVTGDAGAQAITAISADDEKIYVDTPAPFVTIAPNPGLVPPTLPEDPINPGDTIPLWFTIDLDLTSAVGAGGASTTGFIATDRLTLDEGLDLRTVLPRTEPLVAGVPVASELEVSFVASSTTDACTVNAAAEVNGGLAFTFLDRASAPRIGTFDPLPAGTGRGTLRVMGFEGHANTPILTTSDITFSAVPSSAFPEGSATQIASGTGVTGVAMDRNFRISSDGVTPLAVAVGAFSSVEAGDVCMILGSADATPRAATSAGTYLVKHVIEPNEVTTRERQLTLTTNTLPANTAGWASILFPTLVSADTDGAQAVIISNALLNDATTSAWDATGTIYLIAQPNSAALDYGTANFKVNYSAVDTASGTFTTVFGTEISFDGSIAGAAARAAIDALPEGTLVSGFFRFDVTMDLAPEDILPRNAVGSLVPVGVDVPIGGFSGITVIGPGGPFQYEIALPNLVAGPPGVDEMGIVVATPIANTSFVNNENAYVYDNVTQYIQIDQSLGNTTWDAVHTTPGLIAIMPGDQFVTLGPALVPGFRAQAGVFLEPSWPRPTLNLSGADERVVDAGNSVPLAAIGFRDPTAFGEAADEPVTWEIRRIRRFHNVLSNVGELLGPLRYVYQIRRGTITAFGTKVIGPSATPYPFVVTSTGGTQLGGFDDDLVNVNPGDVFRLLDDDGITVLDEIEIGGIEGPDDIWLKPPGILAVSAADVPGKPFEIYLRQAPVPHEQSNEQLLTMITDQVLLERRANLSTQVGGIVEVEMAPTDPRRVQDTDKTINYDALGIQEGDIVVIDPAGVLSGPLGAVPTTGLERGTRAFGDRSVPNRTLATAGQEVPFIAGGPSQLDDNRGWYRVTTVAKDALTVSSETDYSADPGGGFVTFGTTAEYTVLPTVSASTAPFADPPGGPGLEGQMDLRPTAFAGENGSPSNSFLGNLFSIAPFSYRVIRPSSLFSSEAVDLVLLMRERTLSFLEEFDVFFREDKYGNYFVFQRDQHVADLGNPLIPDEGKGVMSNELIDGVRGLIGISPFANTSDALSVLDRRFWVNDDRLDHEFPPGSPPGTPSYSTLESNADNPAAEEGDGRPVLPDRIDDVLNNNDQFRELRLAWLDFRTNREDGTLVRITRFEDELPKKRRDELRQLRLAQSVKDAGS
jgi:hypothetical protein